MITIKELAKELGLSPSTVSVVLNGKAAERKISIETQKQVLQAAADRGYQPNIAARRLKEGYGSDELQIAIYWALDFRASMIARFLEGIRQQLSDQSQRVRLVVHPYETGKLYQAKALFSASDCHAAIVGNAAGSDLKYLEENAPIIPTVLYNRISDKFCCASMDHQQIGRLAADAFADNHCKRTIIVSNRTVFSDMDLRIQSFFARATERGMDVDGTYFCNGSATDSYGVTKSLLTQCRADNLPDGIFCTSSMTAHGVLRALWENNIAVPQNMKIVAVGNGLEEDDACTIPNLSVIKIHMEQVAAECMRILLEMLSGTIKAPYTKVFPVEYVARESCGPLCHPIISE